jgi:hypothetical protein
MLKKPHMIPFISFHVMPNICFHATSNSWHMNAEGQFKKKIIHDKKTRLKLKHVSIKEYVKN